MNKDHKDKVRSIRIIGGTWRSRKIDFANDPLIRPTPSRIRETLFNWLQYSVRDARCLEPYAGSGILSLEALSRGARHITVIDHSVSAIRQIAQNLESIAADETRYDCIHHNAYEWIKQQNQARWDIIFLDPPFHSQELKQILPLIDQRQLIAPDGFVYIETAYPISQDDIPDAWQIHRKKNAAKVHYCLCRERATSR